MMLLPALGVALAAGFCLYTYLGYPAILRLLSLRKRRAQRRSSAPIPPRISIVVPVYNEVAVIAGTLERILAIDYPADRRQILVVSDASADGTDEIVPDLRAAASSCCGCRGGRGRRQLRTPPDHC